MENRKHTRHGTTVNGIHYEMVSDHEELLSWFDYENNPGLDPHNIKICSIEPIWMKCPKCNHRIFTSPYRKFRGRITKCAACEIILEVNNFDKRNALGIRYPELTKYWDFENNEDTPYDVTYASAKKRWFKCRTCGRTHLKPIRDFINTIGCSSCVRQLRTSFGEQALFYYIEKEVLGTVNGDRTVIAPVELDIIVPETNPTGVRTAIEYCGSIWHATTLEQTLRKYEACRKLGIRFLIVWEKLPRHDIPDLSRYADWYTYNNSAQFVDIMEQSIRETCRELGIFPDIDLNRDRDVILSRMNSYHVRESVADDPILSSIWMYDKNSVDPATVYRTSHTKFWFKCRTCGHARFIACCEAVESIRCKYCCVKSVEMWTEDGKTFLKRWNNAADAARELSNGTSYSFVAYRLAIGQACKGKYESHGHVLRGHYWKYADHVIDDDK